MTTKEKIALAALELFQEKWFQATSTSSIAKHAWFATWTFFVHFPSKVDLLNYLYISTKEESYENIFIDLDRKSTAKEQLQTVFHWNFRYYLDNYSRLVFIEQFMNSIYISQIDISAIAPEMKEYELLFAQAKKEGSIRQQSSPLLFASISGLFFSLTKLLYTDKDIQIEDCVDVILRSISEW